MSKVPVHPPINEIRIDLHWHDKIGLTTKNFSSVQELAEFLKDNPALAQAVGYIHKKR